jgi:hypothetical protein
MLVEITPTRLALAALVLGFGLFFVIAGGGIALLATLFGTAVALLSAPVLWLLGKRRRAGTLLAGWATYLVFYVVVSTAMAVAPMLRTPQQRFVGEEVCADSGCFAVDKIDRTTVGPENAYTLFWHLASTDRQMTKHFPGKGLELYLFDDRGRTFRLPDNANQNPLDITLPAGATVRQSMTFHVPADARELFLTAKYRPYTFQSLLPGTLSLVPLPSARMIRIQ